MILLAPLGSAVAAEPVAPLAKPSACASVADPTARLACYDAESGRVATAPSVAPVREPASAATSTEGPPSRVSAVSPAEASFGDTGQLPGDTEGRRHMPSQLEAYVKRVASLPNGRYRLTLNNNQVWQTTESDWAVEFNPEDAVTIARLPLGGYQIALSGGNRYLGVKRTQ